MNIHIKPDKIPLFYIALVAAYTASRWIVPGRYHPSCMQYGILLGFFAGAHYERQRYLHTEQWEHVSILSKASPYILPFVAGDGLRFLFMGIAKASLLVFLVGLVMFLVQVGAILYTMGIGRNRINQTPLPQQQ